MTTHPQNKPPWYRPRNVLLLMFVLAVVGIGWVVVQIWNVYTASPKITHDYRAEFRQLAAQAAGVSPSSGDNAWNKLIEAVTDCNRITNEYVNLMETDGAPRRSGADPYDTPFVDFQRVSQGRYLPDHIEPELAVLQRLREQGVFEKLREFAHMGIGFRTGDAASSMIFELMPELAQCRNLAKARAASMRLASIAHDDDEVADAFDDLLAMAQTISYQPSVIFHLVAQSIQMAAIEELRSEMMEFDFDTAHCRRFRESIDHHPLAEVKLALEGERRVFWDFVQRVYTDDGTGNGYVDVGAMGDIENGGIAQNRTLSGLILGRFARADRRETLASYDSYIDQCIAQCDVPTSSRWTTFNVDAWLNTLPKRMAIVRLIAPALQKFIDSTSRTAARLDQMRIMIALQEYRIAHAEFPEHLESLEPDFLASLPIDANNDQSFVYRRITDDPFGRPYLLYSMGVDGIDNGGVEKPEEKRPSRTRAKAPASDFDIVFNAPRREPEDEH